MVGHVYGNICLAIRAESSIIHLFISSSLHLFKEWEKGERGQKGEKEKEEKRGKGGKGERGEGQRVKVHVCINIVVIIR